MKPEVAFASVLCLALSAPVVRAQEVSQKVLSLRVPLEAKDVKGAPYSAEVVNESTQSLTDGNRILQRTTGRVYRDGQGRVRREEDRPSGSPSVSIIDPAAGVAYSLDPENHIAWKTPTMASRQIMEKMAAVKRDLEASGTTVQIPGDPQRRLDEERRKQEAEARAAKLAGGIVERRGIVELHREETLDSRTIEGVQASGHRWTTTIPAGAIGNDLPISIVSEEWVAPDLNVLVMTHRTDPRSGESSYRLTNIVQAEPDPSLFQVPPDYTVKETGIRRVEQQQD
jgi:hypothetical protein